MMSLASVLEETRSLLFQDENHFTSLVVADVDCAGYALPSSAITPKNLSTNEDVYIISSEEDSQYCQLLRRLILSENPSLIIKSSSDENNSARLSYLDQARLIIPLLSSSFMKSPELVHELNIAWCRQRNNSSLCFLAITLDQLPDKPTYAHIFPSFFNCEDDQWTKTPAQLKEMPSTELANLLTSCTCPQNIVYCFFTAAHFLHEWMAGRECLLIGLHDKFANFFHLRRCIQRSKETSLKLNDAESHQSDNKDEILVIATNSDPKCDALETSSKILENTSEGELKLGVENNCALDEDVVESIETAPNKVTACNHVDKDETKRTGDEIKLKFEKNKPEKSSTSSTTCLIF